MFLRCDVKAIVFQAVLNEEPRRPPKKFNKFLQNCGIPPPTVVKWISHEWGIILQSSFLCHPLSGHGIDHEAISMWNEKDEDWDSCAISLWLLSRSRWNDGDHKNKSSGDTRLGVLCGWRSKVTPDNFATQKRFCLLASERALTLTAL